MTIFETDSYETDELYEGEYGQGEYAFEEEDEAAFGWSGSQEGQFFGSGETDEVYEISDETEEELAMELLSVSSEEELDQFLGKLVSRVAKGARALVKSPIGKALGGVLKKVAKTALPMVGSAIGSFVAPGVGTALGGKLGAMASNLLEAEEAEMLGEEEAQYEAARRYVRWASGTIRNVARAPRTAPPSAVLRSAATSSARRYAPALLASQRRSPWRQRRGPGWGSVGPVHTTAWGYEPDAGDHTCRCGASHGSTGWDTASYEGEAPRPPRPSGGVASGRWVRRGNRVVLLDVR